MINFKQFGQLYKNQLLQEVIPFWMNHSIDKINGGFYTCINQVGKVYDTDKFMWLQGRQVWMFSTLYNRVEQKQQWLKIALDGASFMEKFGRDDKGNWYFSLTQTGVPLVAPYNIFSDCFATMAFAELYKATKNETYKQISLKTYNNIKSRQFNTKGIWNKSCGNRPMKNFSLPMILCNLGLILQDIIGKQQVDIMIKPLIKVIIEQFLCPDLNIILQNVGPNGQFVNSFQGRSVNAGHGNQSIWFLLNLAKRYQDVALIQKLQSILISTIQYAWDKQFGGILYFLDIQGHPPQQLQWDQKLWWVHIQTMISLLKIYKERKSQKVLEWFKRIHNYTWDKFRDPVNKGQWFGYLNRRGQVLLRLKGGKWKGCFHVPRGLLQLWKTCEQLQMQVKQ